MTAPTPSQPVSGADASSAAVNADERPLPLGHEYFGNLCGGFGGTTECEHRDYTGKQCLKSPGEHMQAYHDMLAQIQPAPSSANADERQCDTCRGARLVRIDAGVLRGCPACNPDPAPSSAKVDDQTTAAGEDALADWLGAHDDAYNVFDITDEATTWIKTPVEDLARALLASNLIVPREQHDREVREASEKALTEFSEYARKMGGSLVAPGCPASNELVFWRRAANEADAYREAKP